MRNFKFVIFVLIIALFILQMVVSKSDSQKLSQKPTVAVSTFALYDITKHIAGESVEIVNILPFGVDPHSFEPTPKLMVKIEKSSLVLYSGAGLEPWTKGFTFKSKAINMSQHVALRDLSSDEFEFHQHHDHQCAHNSLDPHYWLDFSNMKKATTLITKELIELSPKNAVTYTKNEKEYLRMLDKLDTNYTKYLSSCRAQTVILNHNSIGYLGAKYHFNVESLSGLSPESEPTAKDIQRIIEHIKEDSVSTIFYENFVNDKTIKTLAQDANVKVEVIQPLGNITADEAANNVTYEDVMYLNLKKLSKALMCN